MGAHVQNLLSRNIVMLSVALLCLMLGTSFAAQAQTTNAVLKRLHSVEQLRLWHSPNRTRVVFDVSADVQHRMFTLQNPLRLVVDLDHAERPSSLPTLDADNPHISRIRTGQPNAEKLRFVFELKRPLKSNSFVLSPNELYGHRLVIDLEGPASPLTEKSSEALTTRVNAAEPSSARSDPVSRSVAQAAALERPFLVAVDAGHGGEDPGALGYRGSREKTITLAIAKKLVAKINQNPKMQGFLVREGDYYIKLQKRRELARAREANMFISIHADAFTKSSARGFSVFALSQRGATSAMAGALAAKENASDLIGGVSLADKDEVLAKVLVDLSMTNTVSESINFGGRVLKELGQLGRLHSKHVEQANFSVLRSADIPSILVETGFITNPQEEKNLRSSRYQRDVAQAIYAAIDSYLAAVPFKANKQYAAATLGVGRSNTQVYQSLVKPPRPKYHKVVRGDSLSAIADRYGISVAQLKRSNGLKNSTIVLGQRLKLTGATRSPNRSVNNQVKRGAKQQNPSYHTVRRGESLSLISARYNVTIKSLKSLNKLSKNTVYVGQKLALPGGSKAVAKKPQHHLVKRGDTLSEIAEQYGSSIRQIMRANGMRSRTVRLGQKLKIP